MALLLTGTDDNDDDKGGAFWTRGPRIPLVITGRSCVIK